MMTTKKLIRLHLLMFGCATLFLQVTTNNSYSQSKLTEHTVRLDDGNSGKGKLAQLSWLEGYWIGEGLGGTADENWSPAVNGSMTGTFRLWENEKLKFSEFFTLDEVEGTLSLKLKHYDANFYGWEAKDRFVEFKLVKIEGKTAWFDGLTYHVDDLGTLHAYVAITKKDKSVYEGEFTFRRKKR